MIVILHSLRKTTANNYNETQIRALQEEMLRTLQLMRLQPSLKKPAHGNCILLCETALEMLLLLQIRLRDAVWADVWHRVRQRWLSVITERRSRGVSWRLARFQTGTRLDCCSLMASSLSRAEGPWIRWQPGIYVSAMSQRSFDWLHPIRDSQGCKRLWTIFQLTVSWIKTAASPLKISSTLHQNSCCFAGEARWLILNTAESYSDFLLFSWYIQNNGRKALCWVKVWGGFAFLLEEFLQMLDSLQSCRPGASWWFSGRRRVRTCCGRVVMTESKVER